MPQGFFARKKFLFRPGGSPPNRALGWKLFGICCDKDEATGTLDSRPSEEVMSNVRK